jgi:signal transduction histidine kinase
MENALRHTPAGGEIQIGSIVNGAVQIWVEDTGEGIDADDLPYVFDRFYRADKARNASSGKMGMGLAICKALVEAQGGTITVASVGKGHGTKMEIVLPANSGL